jgi:hypothetical protein
VPENLDPTRPPVQDRRDTDAPEVDPFPEWFTAFLHHRQTRKPSAHTVKAYRHDFLAIAILITNGDPAHMDVVDITKDSMRAAFAAYAHDHEAASFRRCWSTWNALCTYLYTSDLLPAAVAQGGISDLFVLSHGWNNGIQSARDLYQAMFTLLADQLGEHRSSSAAIGIPWPSLLFPDDDPAAPTPPVHSTGAEIRAALAPAFPDQQYWHTTDSVPP